MTESERESNQPSRIDPYTPLPFDLVLLRNSPITMYHSRSILENDLQKVVACGYQSYTFDCAVWQSEMDMHRALAAKMSFPDYYGHNLDALNDCLGDSDVILADTLIVLVDFNAFFQRFPRAWHVLDIIAQACWFNLLFGRKVMGFIHTSDPNITFQQIGAKPVMWNPLEWFDSSRRAH